MKKIAILLLPVIALLGGCLAPKTVYLYGEKGGDTSGYAVLEQNPKTGMKIIEIDGKRTLNALLYWDPDVWREVVLNQGEHTLRGRLTKGNRYADFYISHKFEAGKRYRMMFEIIDNESVNFFVKEL